MLLKNRHAAICDIIRENNIILIREISAKFGVSLETARRDLEALQDQGLVKRIHGGAVLADDRSRGSAPGPLTNSYAEKKAIGRKAASLVHSGETIFLDTGTTTLEVARNLKTLKNLTVITNSINIINELIGTDIHMIVLGGELLHDEQFIYSHATEQMANLYFADKAFFSCGGITFTHGVSDYGATLDRTNIVHRSDEAILLADSGKFGKNAKFKACEIGLVDKVVVDSNLQPMYLSKLREYDVEVLVAEVSPLSWDLD